MIKVNGKNPNESKQKVELKMPTSILLMTKMSCTEKRYKNLSSTAYQSAELRKKMETSSRIEDRLGVRLEEVSQMSRGWAPKWIEKVTDQ